VLLGCFGKPCEEFCDILKLLDFVVAEHGGKGLFVYTRRTPIPA
jgi:hypothetical protein